MMPWRYLTIAGKEINFMGKVYLPTETPEMIEIIENGELQVNV